MTMEGWIFFALSWAGLLILNIYCFKKVFKKKKT